MKLLQCMSWAQSHHSYGISIQQFCSNYWQFCICIHYCGYTAGHAFLAAHFIQNRFKGGACTKGNPKEHVLMSGITRKTWSATNFVVSNSRTLSLSLRMSFESSQMSISAMDSRPGKVEQLVSCCFLRPNGKPLKCITKCILSCWNIQTANQASRAGPLVSI